MCVGSAPGLAARPARARSRVARHVVAALPLRRKFRCRDSSVRFVRGRPSGGQRRSGRRERSQKKAPQEVSCAQASDAGTRTRVSWVKAKYADHLHHIGMSSRSDWNSLPDQQRCDLVKDQKLVKFLERSACFLDQSAAQKKNSCKSLCTTLSRASRARLLQRGGLDEAAVKEAAELAAALASTDLFGEAGGGKRKKAHPTPSPPPRPPRPGI